MRIIYCILGFITLGLGIIGIVLPIIPTVPFLLLTSFFFSKGSKRFNDWFTNSKIYKRYLEGFVKNKIMTLKSEIMLLAINVSIFLDKYLPIPYINGSPDAITDICL